MISKADAVNELLSYDHCFIPPEEAKKITEPFGVEARCYVQQCDYKHPKGLTFADGRKEAYGIAAEVLAMQICHDLKIEYRQCLGRGSQLRACCNAIDAHLKAHKEPSNVNTDTDQRNESQSKV